MAKAILRPTREARVRSGHPWVFASDIDRAQGDFEPGDVVYVESSKGTFPEHRGLAAAAGPQQGHELLAADIEVYVL